VNRPNERQGKRRLQAAAFVVDFLIITALASPLWWLLHQRGVADAVVSGVISGALFAVFWSVIFHETVGLRIAKRLRLRR
jgi:membrane associated rhomboid family serine protease